MHLDLLVDGDELGAGGLGVLVDFVLHTVW